MEYYAPRLRQYARELRKNMTKEERKLWFGFLRTLPVTVKRQARIGCYIADFYIPSCRLAIELDGSQHYEEAGLEYIKEEKKLLRKKGSRLSVIRTTRSRKTFPACARIS